MLSALIDMNFAEMTFDLPNEHPLARHMQMCRLHGELPLVARPIRDIEDMMQVTVTCD